MSIPVFRTTVAAGATDAGGAWTYTGIASAATGNVLIFHLVQDGATAAAVALTGATNVENLAGTDNAWTSIGRFDIGSPAVAYNHLWIGRSINTSSAPTASGTNSTSEDVYMRIYEYSSVNTGTTLASVIENGSAGSTANAVGAGGPISDTAVTTLGPDRLALNFAGLDDDEITGNLIGASGGTWDGAGFDQYASASGTDASLWMFSAPMVAAGTIDGGTQSTLSNWGMVGFALIGTTVAAPGPAFSLRHAARKALQRR